MPSDSVVEEEEAAATPMGRGQRCERAGGGDRGSSAEVRTVERQLRRWRSAHSMVAATV
jgi:hypothetical protein